MASALSGLPIIGRRQFSTLAAALVAGCASSAAGDATPSTGFAFTPPRLAETLATSRRDAPQAAIIRAAERTVARPPQPMRRVHTEGTLPHQGIYDESLAAMRDMPAMRDLAIAGRITGDSRYTEAAARYAGAWAATYTPSFNPIDETGFDGLFLAWDLVPPAERAPHAQAMDTLLQGFASGYPHQTVRGSTGTNNWNSHRAKIAALASFATGDAALIAQARVKFESQVDINIDADGLTLDFGLRDALHYVVYDLEPLVMVVLAARRHGQDWYGAGGGKIGRALTWLLAYAAGEKIHQEFVNSTVSFDAARRNAGVKGFDGPFEPTVARSLYAMAARIDPTYRALAQSLRRAASDDAWLDVLWPLG